jgi:hypothetical protein
VKDSLYEELERVFDKFSKYHTKILLGDITAKVGREDISKPTIENESLHEISNNNGVRLVNFATSKNLRVKPTMFPHRNIHKYTWTSAAGKTHIQIDYILVDRRRHSNVIDVRSFRAEDCDNDHIARMEEKRNAYRLLVKKPEGKRPLGRPRRRWVDNIRMDLGEVGWGDVNWIDLAKDRNRWRALVNSVLNLRVPRNAGKLSRGLTSSVLSSSAQLYRVSYIFVLTCWPLC